MNNKLFVEAQERAKELQLRRRINYLRERTEWEVRRLCAVLKWLQQGRPLEEWVRFQDGKRWFKALFSEEECRLVTTGGNLVETFKIEEVL